MAAPHLAPAWVPFVHPALAGLSLVLAFVTMRRGLLLRDARVKRKAPPPKGQRKHVALARPVVLALVGSFALGLGSAVLVRGFKPLNTAHGWFALLATACFAGTGLIGTGLTRDPGKRRAVHALLAVLALGLGLLAALTGIELLP